MRIAVFSDTRQPTKADGGHGLGMSAHSIASGLLERGHDVTLCAKDGSEFNGRLLTFATESEMANWYLNNHEVDVILDTGHHHQLSKFAPNSPVVNRIADMECQYRPPNSVVNSRYMLDGWPDAKLINTGIKDPGYFRSDHDGYLLFAGRQENDLGWSIVKHLARVVDMPLKVAEGLSGKDKWQLFSGAAILLHLSTKRAAPRLPVELGYCGVPTICLDNDGTASIVTDGVTGVVAFDIQRLSSAIKRAMQLDRATIYDWYKRNHDYERMIDGYETILREVREQQSWKRHSAIS